MRERLLVIGGDAAGMSAAATARRLHGPDRLDVIVLEAGGHTSYSACGIPYWIAGDVPTGERLIARRPEQFAASGIDVRLHTLAEGIDLDRREVIARGPTGPERVGFDLLMLGTGAEPVRPAIPGIDAPGVFGVQTLGDGHVLRTAIDLGVRRVVVVGGGYIGLELAEAMVRRGLIVTLVERASEPMGTLDPDMAVRVREALTEQGVTVIVDDAVQEVRTGPDGRVCAVVTGTREIPCEAVVLGLGVRPRSALAGDAGLPLGPSRGVTTDDRQRVAALAADGTPALGPDGTPVADPRWAGIWAAGDCTEVFDRVAGRLRHVALGTHANKQGRVAGSVLAGRDARFGGVVGTAITRICDLEVARTGLRTRDCADLGIDAVSATITASTRAGYFPGSAEMTVKMLAERGTGRLLGAQITGGAGAAKRIDVVATALWTSMTAEDLAGVDLAYAPPFAPVWDPVLVAARKVAAAAAA